VFDWSGLSVIHLRPTYFLEWLLYQWQLPYLQKGVLSMPAGKGRHSPIAADDQGRAIAALLKSPDKYFGTIIPISGPVEMDHEQMAVELSDALGRKIVFENPSVDEYCASLETMGVPAYIIQHLSGAMVDYQNGHMSGSDNNVEKLTGRRSMSSCHRPSEAHKPLEDLPSGRAGMMTFELIPLGPLWPLGLLLPEPPK
jgi:hypothetical protein